MKPMSGWFTLRIGFIGFTDTVTVEGEVGQVEVALAPILSSNGFTSVSPT